MVGSTSAGAGPTHLVADRHGRMIATDTRGDAVRVFTPLPTPHEVASITQRGGPYGIAYDAARDRLWVASSGTNEVVGYDNERTHSARAATVLDGAEPLHPGSGREQRPSFRRRRLGRRRTSY